MKSSLNYSKCEVSADIYFVLCQGSRAKSHVNLALKYCFESLLPRMGTLKPRVMFLTSLLCGFECSFVLHYWWLHYGRNSYSSECIGCCHNASHLSVSWIVSVYDISLVKYCQGVSHLLVVASLPSLRVILPILRSPLFIAG